MRELLRQLSERDMRVHSMLVHWRGRTVFDLWQWPHEPTLKHKIHSATKSFTGTAVGFAEAEGLLDLDAPVVSFFDVAAPSENLRRMRVRDLLTMRTGHARGLSGATTRLRTTGWVEEFLAEPVVEPPGGEFRYSSTTSHVLSAIVQQVAGEPVDSYLRPRLFDPLGIEDFTWEHDPVGVASGGNGLSMRPGDLLKFGVLYLRDGVWQDRQVLPTGWVRRASTLHVERAISGAWNGRELVPPPADAVADSGYGYQFWVTEDGIYDASGIFGQECMVFPEFDGVVVVTGAMGDPSYHDLPDMLRTAFRRMFTSGDFEAPEWIERARRPEPLAAGTGPARSGTYYFEPNDQGLRSLSVEVGDTVVLVVVDDLGEHRIEHGLGEWLPQHTGVSVGRLHHSYQDKAAPILAGAHQEPDALHLKWHFLEAPFIDELTLTFDDDTVTVAHSVNVNSGRTELPPTRGTLSVSSRQG